MAVAEVKQFECGMRDEEGICMDKSDGKNHGAHRFGFHSAVTVLYFAFLTTLLLNSGCDTIGGIGGVIAQAIPKNVDAAYKGLAHQDVIVMVWMDRAMKNDYPDVQLDIAASLQSKLIDQATKVRPDCLKGANFPILASAVVDEQDNHPEWNNESIVNTAAKFDGTRLIYVEVKDFATHAGAPELFRGQLKADLKVLEISVGKDKVARAKVVYQENDIAVSYPKDTPTDGLPIGTEYSVTQGTVDAFTTEVGKRFYPHLEDRD
jgi:hypothetical protein